jgi:4-hydroxybenzoate polyprenyltransferase
VVFVAVFMGLGEGITQDVRDVDNDEAGGRRTTPVVFGVPTTVTIAWVFQVLSIGAWIWFSAEYPLPLLWAVAGTVALVAWLVWFAKLVVILRARFDKRAARLTHVGPMFALTAVNLCALAGVLTG